MFNLVRETYNTYYDRALKKPEGHALRLLIFAFLSVSFAIFSAESVSNVYSMMATGLTVLTGFTFTALFSDHALASSGLPAPKNENDRQDLVRLSALAVNFRARSSYFITISIISVTLLVGASFNFEAPVAIDRWLRNFDFVDRGFAYHVLKDFFPVFAIIFATFVNFIYLECLYTFYRLAETILAILDTRRNYLTADN